MARDEGLEELLRADLEDVAGLTEKPMFGGLAWLLNGHLLCGARQDGMLIRLGKGLDAWALALPGIGPMIMRGRPMQGWVRAEPVAFGDDDLRRNLLRARRGVCRYAAGEMVEGIVAREILLPETTPTRPFFCRDEDAEVGIQRKTFGSNTFFTGSWYIAKVSVD